MYKLNHPVEKHIQTITYKRLEFEVVERPDVIWVGCVDYANNNTDESEIIMTLKLFQGLIESAPIRDKMNPDWSAALSINYNYDKMPCGIMFANESFSDSQDERYDLFTQPSGLWLHVSVSKESDMALLGRQNYGTFEYFGLLRIAAEENGYIQNSEVHLEIEYHCHAEYNYSTHTNYAYIPICTV